VAAWLHVIHEAISERRKKNSDAKNVISSANPSSQTLASLGLHAVKMAFMASDIEYRFDISATIRCSR